MWWVAGAAVLLLLCAHQTEGFRCVRQRGSLNRLVS
jgi:hypothetical protein